MSDEAVTFDVDGLIKDLDYLESVYEKHYQEHSSEYLRGYLNSIQILRNCVYKNRHVMRWKQGTLFGESERWRS